MIFRDKDNKLRFALHYPNDKYKEHPIFTELYFGQGRLQLVDKK
jgi:hypothetical protein